MKSSLRAKRMARNHRRMQQNSKLNLVSLMDIFTILVFFLMVNSGDVEVLQSDKNIKLPDSVAEQKPDLSLLIKISETDVIVQGRSVASVADILNSDQDAIAGLTKELEYLAERKPLLTDQEKQQGRSVTIMGDQNIPYTLLKRVMSTCAQADYRDISLAVNALPKMDEQAFIEANSSTTVEEG
ncbi:ExbD/TolR family protein [Oceanicoccus sagamiensis]|nr:biopolymer transporter ExbD [Oceanicoccus sagamiensis]